jgi:RimJ/RimL family protein N-acetyltransferase
MAEGHPINSLKTYQTTITFADGSNLDIRAINQNDEERLVAFFSRLSRHAVYLRFHNVLTHLSEKEAKRFCNVDYHNTFALVAIIKEGQEEKIIAVGRYYRLPHSDEAEIAFVVEDKYQHKGIGTHLLKQLATIAREKGIRNFQAEVLVENHDMIQVFKESGFPLTEEREQDTCRVVINIDPNLD